MLFIKITFFTLLLKLILDELSLYVVFFFFFFMPDCLNMSVKYISTLHHSPLISNAEVEFNHCCLSRKSFKLGYTAANHSH